MLDYEQPLYAEQQLPGPMRPWGKLDALRVLCEAYERAEAAWRQCYKLSRGTPDEYHDLQDYVSIAALHGVDNPRLRNAAAPAVSKSVRQAIAESARAPNSTVLNPQVAKRTGRKVEWAKATQDVKLFDSESDLVTLDRWNRPVGYATSDVAVPHDMGEREQREAVFAAGAHYLRWERGVRLAELEKTDSDGWWSYHLVVEYGKTQREAAAALAISVSTVNDRVERIRRKLAEIPPPPMGKEWRFRDPQHPAGGSDGYGWHRGDPGREDSLSGVLAAPGEVLIRHVCDGWQCKHEHPPVRLGMV